MCVSDVSLSDADVQAVCKFPGTGIVPLALFTTLAALSVMAVLLGERQQLALMRVRPDG